MALLRTPEETKRDEHRWAQLMKYREGFRSQLGRSWCPEIKAEKHKDRTGRTWMATYSRNTSTKSTKIHILGERRRLFIFRRCQPTSIHKELRKWRKVLGAILIWEGAIHFWDLVGIVNNSLSSRACFETTWQPLQSIQPQGPRGTESWSLPSPDPRTILSITWSTYFGHFWDQSSNLFVCTHWPNQIWVPDAEPVRFFCQGLPSRSKRTRPSGELRLLQDLKEDVDRYGYSFLDPPKT
jgi:hypothetical protein